MINSHQIYNNFLLVGGWATLGLNYISSSCAKWSRVQVLCAEEESESGLGSLNNPTKRLNDVEWSCRMIRGLKSGREVWERIWFSKQSYKGWMMLNDQIEWQGTKERKRGVCGRIWFSKQSCTGWIMLNDQVGWSGDWRHHVRYSTSSVYSCNHVWI